MGSTVPTREEKEEGCAGLSCTKKHLKFRVLEELVGKEVWEERLRPVTRRFLSQCYGHMEPIK